MDKADVIIVGAGAAGLAAAYELSLVNINVIVLEARARIGGRIHSVCKDGFDDVVEVGAEFIHGQLPYTLNLLKKAGINHYIVGGRIYRVYKGEIEKTSEFIEGWDEVMNKLRELKHDMSIADFLHKYFDGNEHAELRQSLIGYVEGYDAADTKKASSFALRNEWENEEEEQGRVEKGYGELVKFLAEECTKRNNKIQLSEAVRAIEWQKGKVEITTASGLRYTSTKAIITLPLGIWQSVSSNYSISYTPALHNKFGAAQKMGFGGVIKFNLQFLNAFWEEEVPNKMKKASFILSDAAIPTWWTQNPKENAILSGWVAGPKAIELKDLSEKELLRKAIHSLAYIFSVHEQFIINRLKAHLISNWMNDPFTLGAYSYVTLETAEALKILREPVEDTLYFAGEALYEGTETGTVEGALVSGIETARSIISSQ